MVAHKYQASSKDHITLHFKMCAWVYATLILTARSLAGCNQQDDQKSIHVDRWLISYTTASTSFTRQLRYSIQCNTGLVSPMVQPCRCHAWRCHQIVAEYFASCWSCRRRWRLHDAVTALITVSSAIIYLLSPVGVKKQTTILQSILWLCAGPSSSMQRLQTDCGPAVSVFLSVCRKHFTDLYVGSLAARFPVRPLNWLTKFRTSPLREDRLSVSVWL